jgi:hypothetical protein
MIRSRYSAENESKNVEITNLVTAQYHVSILQEEMDAVIQLLHGLRASKSAHDLIKTIITMIPNETFTANRPLSAEILRYAGSWSDRDLIRRILAALNHPLYDESFQPSFPYEIDFDPDTWSAILYAHVQLGLINSSRFIFQTMAERGLSPRSSDISIIVSGVARSNLETGHLLAIKLARSLDITAYETIFELALEAKNREIIEWAHGFVVHDDKDTLPISFGMLSGLSSAMGTGILPTRTPRAIGAIIKRIAKTSRLGIATQMLKKSSLQLHRDVYDELYDIACDSGQIRRARWLADEMRKRGWMPRNYRALKRQIRLASGKV